MVVVGHEKKKGRKRYDNPEPAVVEIKRKETISLTESKQDEDLSESFKSPPGSEYSIGKIRSKLT